MGQESVVNGHGSLVRGQGSLVSGHWSEVTDQSQGSLVSGQGSLVTGQSQRSLVSGQGSLVKPFSIIRSRITGLRTGVTGHLTRGHGAGIKTMDRRSWSRITSQVSTVSGQGYLVRGH